MMELYLKSKKNKDIIVTSDSIIEGVDFFKKDSPESVAQKIITYNLSDLSSMGGILIVILYVCLFLLK